MSSISVNAPIYQNVHAIGAKIKESTVFAGRKVRDWTCSFAQNIQKISQTALSLIAKIAFLAAIITAALAILGFKIAKGLAAGAIQWIERNPIFALNVAKLAGAMLMLSGFATIAAAPGIYATSQTIGCTMESCAKIVHFALDPIFAKGLMNAVSGAAVIAVSNQIQDRLF